MKMYQKIKLLLSASILCLFFVNPMTAVAGPCDALTGKAMGLCMAATDGMKCNSAEPSGSDAACGRIEKQLVEATGEPVPWTCPAYSAESLVATYSNYPVDVTGVTFVNYSSGGKSPDVSAIFINEYGAEWYQLITGLSSYWYPGEYVSRVWDYKSPDGEQPVMMSQAQSEACRAEMKDAYATIKNLACPGGGLFPSACSVSLASFDDGVNEHNQDRDGQMVFPLIRF